MTPAQWLQSKAKYFSVDLNGYFSPPLNEYLSTLPLANRDGKIIDLGCGNGMLLKFLVEFSGHKLEPFGIDFKEKPIAQAKKEIFPSQAANFTIAKVWDYDFRDGPFSTIISSPFYVEKANMRQFTKRCLKHLNKGGRLLYRLHHDALERQKVSASDLLKIPAFQGLGMKVLPGDGLVFCVFDK